MQQTTNIKNKDDFIYGVFLPGNDHLRIIASAFREYKDAGKTMEDFEEDYGCLLEFDKTHTGIKGISFQNDSCKTAFMLKYNT